MTRVALPARRRSVSLNLTHEMNGNDVTLAVQYGLDEAEQVRECFCLPFKTGTDMQALLHQACIAISVGLQHGATMGELRRVLGEDDPNPKIKPRSFLGLVIRAGAHLDDETLHRHLAEHFGFVEVSP